MRDLTKILSAAETLKLRALLSQQPDIPIDSSFGQEYPKMLYERNYVDLYRLVKSHPDALVRKEAQQGMTRVIVIVHDIETEEDYLADGWRNDPNDFITMSLEDGGLGEVDPRIPVGKEGRRADKMNRQTREHELRDLRRRYAELTGVRLADAPEAAVDPGPSPSGWAPPPVDVAPVAPVATSKPVKPAPPAGTKREKVAAAARQSAAPSGHSARA